MGKTQGVSNNAIPKPKKLVRISNMLPPSRLSICEVECRIPLQALRRRTRYRSCVRCTATANRSRPEANMLRV